MGNPNGPEDRSDAHDRRESVERGAPADRRGEWDTDDGPASVSAAESDAVRVSQFDHQRCACELGVEDDTLYGFVRVPPDVDRLALLWELDPPGSFTYGPDEAGWVGFEAPSENVGPREVGVALAGFAAQIAERSRTAPD